MSRSQSRKHRGYATQRMLARRWNENGLFPDAYPIGAGEAGEDIQRTPGVEVEVKARDGVPLNTVLKQTVARLTKAGSDDIPVVVWRHNGQGEAAMDEWTVTMRLVDFERYERWRREAQ